MFISWIKAEKNRVEIIDSLLTEFYDGKINIITSILFQVESLEPISQRSRLIFENVIKHKNFQQVTIDQIIIEKAKELRFESRNKGGATLKTPDAIHLATANIHMADELHTFDDKLIAHCKDLHTNSILVIKPIMPTLIFDDEQ